LGVNRNKSRKKFQTLLRTHLFKSVFINSLIFKGFVIFYRFWRPVTGWVRIAKGAIIFSCPKIVHASSGAHAGFSSIGTGSISRRKGGRCLNLATDLHLLPSLTLKNRASYIENGRTATLQMLYFIYFFQQIQVLGILNMLHTLRFPFKCRLFHNATFFGSCIIHILHSGCAKI